MSIRIERYSPHLKKEWDEMVDKAVNSTLIHHRDYMDYHSDRFADYSLMAYDQKDHLVAMMPASHDGLTVCSHGGLTFGGLIVGRKHASSATIMEVLKMMAEYMRNDGMKNLSYKPIPWIYSDQPAQDDVYALMNMGAKVEGVALSSAMSLEGEVSTDYVSRSVRPKLERQGVRIGQSERWEDFYSMLCQCLEDRHTATPVHSLEELLMLKDRFPEKIKLYVAETEDGELLAGSVVYESILVAHCQYMATTERGRRLRAIDAVVAEIKDRSQGEKRYLDLGTSMEPSDGSLNIGLSDKKYAMGARGVLITRLKLEL